MGGHRADQTQGMDGGAKAPPGPDAGASLDAGTEVDASTA